MPIPAWSIFADTDVPGEKKLAWAVVMQVGRDLALPLESYHRRDAERWLEGGKADRAHPFSLLSVCDLFDIDPGELRKELRLQVTAETLKAA